MDDDDDFEEENFDEDIPDLTPENETEEELTEEEEERLRKGYTVGDPDVEDFPEPRDHRRGYTPAQWLKIKALIPRRKWGIHTTSLTDEVGYGRKKNSMIDIIQLTVAWLEVIGGMAVFVIAVRIGYFIFSRT